MTLPEDSVINLSDARQRARRRGTDATEAALAAQLEAARERLDWGQAGEAAARARTLSQHRRLARHGRSLLRRRLKRPARGRLRNVARKFRSGVEAGRRSSRAVSFGSHLRQYGRRMLVPEASARRYTLSRKG